MRKKLLPLIMLMIVCTMVACDKKDSKELTDDNKKEVEVATVSVTEDYTGVAGYIITNQIYDYSNFGVEIYEYEKDIKLPFAPISGAEFGYNEYGRYCFSNVDKEVLSQYISSMKEQGVIVSEKYDEILGQEYGIYKDNMYIMLTYYEDTQTLYFEIYAGNVVSERKVTKNDVELLLKNSSLLEENGLEENYYIIEIQNDSVFDNGYYEFLVFSTNRFANEKGNFNPCYYVVTDGKTINMFSDEIINIYLPTNANIVKKEDKTILVATCADVIGGEGENGYGAVIREYELTDDKFENGERRVIGRYFHNDEWAIVSIIDGKQKVISLSSNEDTELVSKTGNKIQWLENAQIE